MKTNRNYQSPHLAFNTLDLYIVRKSILQVLKRALPLFRGNLLDVGCGYMPYKELLLSSPGNVDEYIGLDLVHNKYQAPDLTWDGKRIPLENQSIDCVVATEVFEHCQNVESVMAEIFRVLKPGGILFFTVPFLWNLHDIPNDEYRYTPFSLERHLKNTGYVDPSIEALGGWDASLAQMLGLWIRRRFSQNGCQRWLRLILSFLGLPIIWLLYRIDSPPPNFESPVMFTGLSCIATKPKY
ncbi:MAG: class I SAM-dependent methyltransferase [Cyanobacteria bacterium J06560_6]